MKATEIKNAKCMAITYIFRGFYLLMSFSGSIGSLVKDSGLKEALGVVYAENTVPHMITRMTISPAFRDHFLVQSALATNLFNLFIVDSEDEAEGIVKDISVEEDEKTVGTVKREDVLRELKNVTKYVKNEGKTTEDIERKDYPVLLLQLEHTVENYKEHVIKSSITGRLWLLYIYYVDNVKNLYSI